MTLIESEKLREQRRLHGRCVHPVGPFVEFGAEDIHRSIPWRFEAIAGRYPDRAAIKTKHQTLTYAELNDRGNRVAEAILREYGDKQEPIALLFEHNPSMIAAMLGVLKAGKFYLPLDPTHPRSRTARILQDSQVRLVVTNERNLPSADRLAAQGVPLLNIDRIAQRPGTKNTAVPLAPASPAYVLYTSGSTGNPKGIVQNHKNVLHDVMQYTNALHLCPEDRMSLFYSYAVNGAVRGIFGALLNGATLYPFDIRDEGFSNIARFLAEEQITIYHSVPTVFRNFVATLTGKETFPNLRVVRFGGERVLSRDVELYKKHFPDDCLIYTGLGSTETGQICQHFIDKETSIAGSIVPLGYPVEDLNVLLLDERRQAVSCGEIGEIAVESRYLFPAYWGEPDLMTSKFLDGAAGEGSRVYLTGDFGLLRPDGCIEHRGRKDFQVKIRGYRTEVAEVEAVLLDHPKINEAVVIAKDDRHGEPGLAAYLVCGNGSASAAPELRNYLKARLPDHMIPMVFVPLTAMPLTPNGKVDRRALAKLESPLPEQLHAYVPPSTSDEKIIAEILAQVLKLDRLGIHDNFFDLGGHSLLATLAVSRIREALAIELRVRTFFESPTVAELAAFIQRAKEEPAERPPAAISPLSRQAQRVKLHS